MKKLIYLFCVIAVAAYMSGCAQVPMASPEQDMAKKKFDPPTKEHPESMSTVIRALVQHC